MKRRPSRPLLPLFLLTACTDPGSGEVELRAWGETFIEEGIPADQTDDGWAISFDRYEVTLRDVSIAGASLDDPDPIDLTRPSMGAGQLVGSAMVTAGDYDDARFTVAAVLVEGQAERDGVSKRFSWSFDQPVAYRDCETTTSVPADGLGTLQITIHADHLFYDSLVSEEPLLGFDAIAAADLDADGEITAAELSMVDIGAFDPGNLPIDDMWSFVSALAATMGHVDAEGHCASSSS